MYRSFNKRLAGKAGQGYARGEASKPMGPRAVPGQKTVEKPAGNGKPDTRSA